MGNILNNIWNKLRNKKARIMMVGLDAAGKTTILHKLKLGETISTCPTIGFNVEEIQRENINMTIWDIGGQDLIRKQWKHFYQDTQAVIFVVDSQDESRMNLVKEELHILTSQFELQNSIFLILANKQDNPKLTVHQIFTFLNDSNIFKNRIWNVSGTCALTGDGIYQAFQWLIAQINKSTF